MRFLEHLDKAVFITLFVAMMVVTAVKRERADDNDADLAQRFLTCWSVLFGAIAVCALVRFQRRLDGPV